ncbi:histidine kinase [Streptomyces sp. 150FB]|uniref:nitrate- and nitrite sensing domain-containing protein n=1 Tax=Streptomyces sp. 150FB TaxID=1576605 RepID=UPI000589120F|nr:nitrate- and nitrite sensing domain-containing protein [Streptomyces sp. 150FB]KIF73465.1 histidine kinase [Streptomyces sp. 150FB]
MGFRGKSIRRKIVALLLVPLVSLTALWAFSTTITGSEALRLLDVHRVIDQMTDPVAETISDLQAERRQTLIYLVDPRPADALATLRDRRATTDEAVARLRTAADDPDVRGSMSTDIRQRMDTLTDALNGLPALRASVDENSVPSTNQALNLYNRVVEPGQDFLETAQGQADIDLDNRGRALIGLDRAQEMVSREDALVASSLLAGQITSEEIRTLSGLVANRELLYNTYLDALPVEGRSQLQDYWRGPDTESLRDAENRLIAAGPVKNPRTIDSERWQQIADPVLKYLGHGSQMGHGLFSQHVSPDTRSVLVRVGVAGILGFVALLLSLIVSVRIARGLIRDLSQLRNEALEVSGVRLPGVMRRLAAGEQVDVETEAPTLDYARDEVGQVGQAVNTLQRAAVEAAVKQADLRRGVSEVFVNLARRNQVLLHRQLTLLDTMERRTEDTDELADLFRLDHLTTRMRRHAEGLVILSGAAASRQWRKPVQLMDVVRAAVAEVEAYERVEVRRLPRIGVGGPAVSDLTHLIAELLENATVFSPPHTVVQVHGERVANGFTLEIHDRGLGMAPEMLLDANLRLAETPEFELSDTDRLGLFVVSRLAQRQNVRVSLQPSPYGGTTAVVFLPIALLTDEAPETQGTGFRLDRKNSGERGRGRAEGSGRLTALAQVPTGLGSGPSVLEGPVEIEPARDILGRDGDTADGAGRRQRMTRDDVLEAREDRREWAEGNAGDPRTGTGDAHTGTGDSDHQHRRAAPDPESEHPGAPVQLPRRKPPTLVTDRGRRVDDGGQDHARPAPEAAAGTTSTPGSADASPPRRPAQSQDADLANEAAAALGGLPRRVRQASLAPQLRGPADRATEPTPTPRHDTERDADEVRNRMASLQRGWQRGRQQNDADDAARPGETHGTTSEGDGR